ncbi:uncharacterized protein PgNI_08680 [Pyricularia grisea]|uniref:Uncharacterized protein n=1 Tax=Pyricularia grisea TaxID=148305 RepID=A0A6P8AUM9_PYRGI|nr:uncharacterized protein PgNI_08680 [Pyricularia grisea]TLD05928.1 hypothetical protein PgNI_08680 [Pyricularia grisea]
MLGLPTSVDNGKALMDAYRNTKHTVFFLFFPASDSGSFHDCANSASDGSAHHSCRSEIPSTCETLSTTLSQSYSAKMIKRWTTTVDRELLRHAAVEHYMGH